MYDWANSAFAATIMASVLPAYYSKVAAANLTPATASSYWGYTNTIAMLTVWFYLYSGAADYMRARLIFATRHTGHPGYRHAFSIQQGTGCWPLSIISSDGWIFQFYAFYDLITSYQ
jgi:UMF1 family MFS transporter